MFITPSNRDWTLSGGTFVGSNPETFTVPARPSGSTPAQTFTTTGNVTVDSSQAAGTFNLKVPAFGVTNTTTPNLAVGTASTYSVIVTDPPDPCAGVTSPEAPVITADPNTGDGNGGWYKSVPTVSATSATSGATITYATQELGGTKSAYSPDAPTLGQGTTEVFAKATSATCDRVSESTRTFMVDTNAPTVNPASVVNNTWRNTDLSQAFTASDGVSGLANATDASFTLTASDESANASTPTVVERTVSDVAGNSTTRSVSAKIDKTAPSVDCGSADTNWHAADVSIACTASDGLSGLADSNDASFNLTTNVAANTETSTAETNSRNVLDNATNSTPAGPISDIMVDKKAPTFGACSTPGPFTQGSGSQTVTITATDNGSGLDDANSTLSRPVDTSTIGSKTVTFTAQDNVENSRTTSCTYDVDYNWNGFFSPIDNLDKDGHYVLNSVKAGSSVPVKFSLKGNQGLNIFATATDGTKYPKSSVIACDPTAEVDAIESTVTAGQSTLQYDASLDQYTYVWKTEKTWTGCRQLEVKLTDGTSHRASFKLTK
jgi:hypothetical protein